MSSAHVYGEAWKSYNLTEVKHVMLLRIYVVNAQEFRGRQTHKFFQRAWAGKRQSTSDFVREMY